MAVHFYTSEFVRSHNRTPRGRGSWAFRFETLLGEVVEDCWFTPGSTTYAEAKKLAAARVAQHCATRAFYGTTLDVVVLP